MLFSRIKDSFSASLMGISHRPFKNTSIIVENLNVLKEKRNTNQK